MIWVIFVSFLIAALLPFISANQIILGRQLPAFSLTMAVFSIHAVHIDANKGNWVVWLLFTVILFLSGLIGSFKIRAIHAFVFIFTAGCCSAMWFLGEQTLQSDEFEFQLNGFLILVLALAMLTGFFLHDFSTYFKWTTNKGNQTDELSVWHALVALMLMIPAFFLGSHLGLVIVGAAYLAGQFMNGRNEPSPIAYLFLSMGGLSFWNQLPEAPIADISLGMNAAALIGGIGLLKWWDAVGKENFRSWKSLLIIALAIIITVALYLMGNQKTDLGGFDTIIALITGIAIGGLFFYQTEAGLILPSVVFVTALGFSMHEINENRKVPAPDTKVQDKREDKSSEKKTISVMDSTGIRWEGIEQGFTIEKNSAMIWFELGPKGGRTKGSIEQFNGTLDLSALRFSLDVTLPVSHLSTFNKYRDESIMEEEYFHVDKFPVMRFKASNYRLEGDGYQLVGAFQMLGATKPLSIRVKFLEVNRKGTKHYVLVGEGEIDRTLFGMKPDSKEGNIVDFQFRVDLLPK
jgi:polyisoprenoid-binding protein YceI